MPKIDYAPEKEELTDDIQSNQFSINFREVSLKKFNKNI